MTEQYTPTTEEVRELIAEAREWASSYASWGDNGLVDRLVDALEAKLTTHDAEVAAKAYAQGVGRTLEVLGTATTLGDGLLTLIGNPYREAVQS